MKLEEFSFTFLKHVYVTKLGFVYPKTCLAEEWDQITTLKLKAIVFVSFFNERSGMGEK